MILLLLCISLSQASISIPIQKTPSSPKDATNFSHFNFSPSLRGLSSSLSLSNSQDSQYYIQASIGTPRQTFTFLVDTGSTWMWIDAVDCLDCHKGKRFSPSKSSTYKNTTQAKNLTYYSKVLSNGYLSTDKISIDGRGSLTVTNQSFILVYDESIYFSRSKADGLIGLGFEELSDGVSSLMTTLKSQGKIKNRQFAIYLNKKSSYSDLKDLGNSNLMIDGHDIEKYSLDKNFTYIDLVGSSGYWEIACDSVIFDEVSYSKAKTAIIDTGVEGILGPKQEVMQLIFALRYDYGCYWDYSWAVYCNCSKSYPTLTFNLSGNTFTLKQTDYFEFSYGRCHTVFGYSTNFNSWILGDSFIRRFYINFDMDGKRIGLANIRVNKDSCWSDDSENCEPWSDPDSSEYEDSSYGSAGLSWWEILLIVGLPLISITKMTICLWIQFKKNKARWQPNREHININEENKEDTNEIPRITTSSTSPETDNKKNLERKIDEINERMKVIESKTAKNENNPDLEEIKVEIECN